MELHTKNPYEKALLTALSRFPQGVTLRVLTLETQKIIKMSDSGVRNAIYRLRAKKRIFREPGPDGITMLFFFNKRYSVTQKYPRFDTSRHNQAILKMNRLLKECRSLLGVDHG